MWRGAIFNSVRRRTGLICTAGLAFFTIAGATSGNWYRWALILGSVTMLCAIAFFVLDTTTGLRRLHRQLPPRQVRVLDRLEQGYRVRHGVSAADVAMVCEEGRKILGEGHARPAELAARIQVCPACLFIVEDQRGRFAGYFTLFPLRKAASKAIQEGRLATGRALGPNDLVSSFRRAHAVYVGMIFGTPQGLDRAATMYEFGKAMREIVRTSPIDLVFSRPGSERGEYWIGSRNLVPINKNGSQIYMTTSDNFS
jgi:hypothetical protein